MENKHKGFHGPVPLKNTVEFQQGSPSDRQLSHQMENECSIQKATAVGKRTSMC